MSTALDIEMNSIILNSSLLITFSGDCGSASQPFQIRVDIKNDYSCMKQWDNLEWIWEFYIWPSEKKLHS